MLPYRPSDEMYPLTVEAWCEDFISAIGKIDMALDAHRIEKAFEIARPTLKAWPSPAMIIELMPRRPEVERLEHLHEAGSVDGKLSDTLDKILAGEITKDQATEMLS